MLRIWLIAMFEECLFSCNIFVKVCEEWSWQITQIIFCLRWKWFPFSVCFILQVFSVVAGVTPITINFIWCNSKLLHCKLWILLCFLPKHNWVASGVRGPCGLTKNVWQSMCFNPTDLTSFDSLIWLRHLGKWLVRPGFHQIWLLTRCRHRKIASAFWLSSHKTTHPV